MKYAILFPGQGAQYPAMGHDFYMQYPSAKKVFEEADDILGMNLSKTIFSSDAEKLSRTDIAQPAIYVTSMAIYTVLDELFDLKPFAVGGLSLGEYTALCVSQKLTFETTLLLIKERGRLMQEASEKEKGVMMVVLGLSEEAVKGAIKPFEAFDTKMFIANINCPGQVVIAGQKEALDVLIPNLKELGAKRILPLSVAGAFHTPMMGFAQDHLKHFIEGAPITSSNVALVMNTLGKMVEDPSLIKQELIKQVASPTRWLDCIKTLDHFNLDLMIEIGPGKTLSGMNRKIQPKARTISIDQLGDIKGLEEALTLKHK